ncbi:hypothetical protein LTR53_019188, partial [Teratosphaeriaceae sp. CCFEE 6253]
MDEQADTLELLSTLLGPLLTWGAGNLVRQYQAGLGPSHQTFSQSLHASWTLAWAGRLRGICGLLFAGGVARLSHTALRNLSSHATDELAERLSGMLWLHHRDKRTLARFDRAL